MCEKNIISYSKFNFSKEHFDYKNSKMPSKLFKYTNVHRAKELLYDQIMYLPKITELNDPYEGNILMNSEVFKNEYANHLSDLLDQINVSFEKNEKDCFLKNTSQKAFNNLQKDVKEGIYILSFCSTNEINSLWAHYTNNHEGICIQYDTKKFNDIFKYMCFPVEYLEDYDSTDEVISSIDTMSLDNHLKLKTLSRKSKDWSYEKEWRIILDDSIIKDNFYPYEPFIKFLEPSAVYMGIEISSKNKNLVKNICKAKNIPLSKAVLSDKSYKFDFEPVEL